MGIFIKNLFKSKLFLAASILVFVAVFLTGIASQKGFEAETEVMAVPKSLAVSQNMGRILGDMDRIMHTLSFYDDVLGQTGMADPATGLSDVQRKDFWNSVLHTRKSENSDIILIKYFASDGLQARSMSLQSAKSLAYEMSRSYNIKTELDVRIIDGPIVYGSYGNLSLSYLFLRSLVVGLIGGVLAVLLFFLYEKTLVAYEENRFRWIHEKKEGSEGAVSEDSLFKEAAERPIVEDIEYVFPPKEEPKKTELEKMPRETPEKKTEEEIKEKNINHHKKASAPSNLPIAGEDVMALFGKADASVPAAEEKTEPARNAAHSATDGEKPAEQEKNVHREPTEEEVRERLNKLLGGGMLK